MSSLREVRSFLALERGLIGLLGMAILLGMGERMAERFLPIYLMALGGTAWAVGLFNAMDNLLSALYSYPGGYLSERLGFKRSLLLFNILAGFGFAVVIAIPRWEAVIVGAVFFLSWSAVSLPASMSLVGKVLPANKRAMGVSMHSLVRRIPKALGPLMAGICIDAWGTVAGIRIAFCVALAMAVASAIVQQALIEEDRVDRKALASLRPPEGNPIRLLKGMPSGLKTLLVSDILIRFCEQIPYPFVVIWCMQRIADPVSGVEFGILTTIEMATAVAIYIPVAHFADRTAKKPFVLVTFAFFAFFPLVLLFSQSFWLLVGAFLIRGLKEFGEPTRKSLILDMCPEDRQASMFGLYYLLRDAVVSLAALGGAFLWVVSPALNFTTAFAFGVIGATWFALRGTGAAASLESDESDKSEGQSIREV